MLDHRAKDNVIEDTVKFWYSNSAVLLSNEEAREAVDNLTGFFDVLREWDERDKKVK